MKKPEDYGSINGLDEFEYNELMDKIKFVQLDTMKDIALRMGMLSDFTTKTQGYKNLLEDIKKLELEL